MVALPLAYDGLRGSGLSAGLIAAVHDEIVFECAEADVEPATAIVHQAMTTGLEKGFGARPRFQDIARSMPSARPRSARPGMATRSTWPVSVRRRPWSS
jgi:DNA polymerase I - 3''-5'' exonuclease and polymerase domains